MSELLKNPVRNLLVHLFRPILIIALGLGSACSTIYPASTIATDQSVDDDPIRPWTAGDVRLLDPADADVPGQDLIAAYVQLQSMNDGGIRARQPYMNEITLRIDFLDLQYTPECDLYLALDYLPGGLRELPGGHPAEVAWETLISLPASGQIQTQNAQGGRVPDLAVQIVRDPDLDYFTISFNAAGLSGSARRFRFQMFTTKPGETDLADSMPPFDATGFPPARADILLAFWNAFPAYTPSQALRRWDGAHTGPFGGRHGLSNLLRTARNHRMPLMLLDLKSPISLSALDYSGGLDLIRQMSAEGSLSLPDTFPILESWPGGFETDFIAQAMQVNREIYQAFDISASQMIYAPSLEGIPGIPDRYRLVLTNQPIQRDLTADPRAVSLERWRDKVVISLPEEPGALQVTTNGLTPEMRRRILQAAISTGKSTPVQGDTIFILGGSLPDSEWGIPQIARSGFRYIAEHPWMQVLNAQDLSGLRPSGQGLRLASGHMEIGEPDLNELFNRETTQLASEPATDLRDNTWGAFLTLFGPQPIASPMLPSLRANYLGQLDVLLEAEHWAAAPADQASCSVDLDQDGYPECVLASRQSFVVLDMDTGALTYAFIRTQDGPHQIMAPSSQIALGTSDPSTWDLSAGLRSDPDVIPGGFADSLGPYHAIIGVGQITLEGDHITKIYRLIEGGISIEITSEKPVQAVLPLIIDPWKRFHKDWGEGYSISVEGPGSVRFEPAQLTLQTGAAVEIHSFTESLRLLAGQEDPNLDYPAGHTLPFPLIRATIVSPGTLQVLLLVEN